MELKLIEDVECQTLKERALGRWNGQEKVSYKEVSLASERLFTATVTPSSEIARAKVQICDFLNGISNVCEDARYYDEVRCRVF